MSESILQEPVFEAPASTKELTDIYTRINREMSSTKRGYKGERDPVWNKHSRNLWHQVKPLLAAMIKRIEELESIVTHERRSKE